MTISSLTTLASAQNGIRTPIGGIQYKLDLDTVAKNIEQNSKQGKAGQLLNGKISQTFIYHYYRGVAEAHMHFLQLNASGDAQSAAKLISILKSLKQAPPIRLLRKAQGVLNQAA